MDSVTPATPTDEAATMWKMWLLKLYALQPRGHQGLLLSLTHVHKLESYTVCIESWHIPNCKYLLLILYPKIQ